MNGRPEINGQQENYGKPAKSVTPQFQGQGEKTGELVTGDSGSDKWPSQSGEVIPNILSVRGVSDTGKIDL